MSEFTKAEKLAAARRKLKEFQNQQKNKENQQNPQTVPQRIPQRDSPPLKQESPVLPTSEDVTSSFAAPQQPSIANYFQNSNKNEIFFDTVHKHVNGDTNSYRASAFCPAAQKYDDDDKTTGVLSSFASPTAQIPSASSLFFTNPDVNSVVGAFPPVDVGIDVTDQNNGRNHMTKDANANELNSLRLELQSANSRIKMQADALDIITAEKEDLQTKLTKIMQEADLYKTSAQSLNNQLAENLSYQQQLLVTVDELKQFKENVLAKEIAAEQNLNDLKEKSDELHQGLEIEKEKNKALQSQLEETRSNNSLLSLKFQQLGIEVNNDHGKDFKSVHDECELWKSKYDELESRLKAMMYEKERTEDEYRQYVVNLKEELESTNAELRRLSDENQILASKISAQTEHISGLERQLQKGSGDANKDAIIAELRGEIENLRQKTENDKETNKQLTSQLGDYDESQRKIYELERELENLRADMTNAHELQMAVESNKVAASQAIAQNTKLKDELEKIHQRLEILNEEKMMLYELLEVEKKKNVELTVVSQGDKKTDNHEVTVNDVAINTDANGVGGENGVDGKANVEAMLLLQEKFKSVLDKMADLTDEKQQLEHLVMQLQCETETIEEYVALYQKQRAVLQQRARETDFKMERVTEEKERLLSILRSILTTDEFDCAFVKELVENNLSSELSDELANNNTGARSHHYEHAQRTFSPNSDSVHHPSCPCCSGQLITI